MSAEQLLLTRLRRFETLEKRQARSFDIISNLRLLVVLAGGLASAVAVSLGTPLLAGYVSCPFLLAFFLLILKHRKVERELNMARAMVEISSRYLDRINGQWVMFAECGQEFAEFNHPYTNDLGIFGSKSLYQWTAVAKTYFGRQQLNILLTDLPKDLQSILMRQKAISELATRLEFCQGLECQGLMTDKAAQNPQELIHYAEEPSLLGKSIKVFRVLPLFTAAALGLYFLEWISIAIPVSLLLLQALIFLFGYKKVSAPLNQVYLFNKSLGSFGSMLQLIETEPFEDAYLCSLKAQLFNLREPASVAMRRLERVSDMIDLRYQGIFYFILNVSLLWDMQCAIELGKWKSCYGKRVGCWLEIIGTLEALSSLSVIAHIHPEWVFPEIKDHHQRIEARGLGHPLLNPERCVRNDIEIDNNTCIVTGSNMSGKSTWLRAIGVNLVLAYAGGPVCAHQFSCSIMDIYTSMEIRDDLINGISTFYAELTRINMILEHSRQGKPMCYLIDEIFRGTNSLDRIAGARVVLKNLSNNGAIGLISTHDFELCDLEKEQWSNFRNYHFEEQYTNGRIEFDYKLRLGRCTTSNARYLMNMVGIEIS